MILGLDSSRRSVGWAIIDHHGRLIDVGEFTDAPKPPKRNGDPLAEDWRHAAVWLRGCLTSINRRLTLEPSMVVVEAPFLGPNRNGSLQHAEWVGMTRMAAYRFWPSALHEAVTAQACRAKLGIKGAGKQPVIDWAWEQLWANPRYRNTLSDHEADAVALAAWGARVGTEVTA